MEHVANMFSWFWAESFWFPSGYTWKDLENTPGSNIYLPQARDINWSILIGFLLLLFRYAIEHMFVVPLGRYLGVTDKKVVPVKPNPILEGHFKKNGFVNTNNNMMESIAKQTDMTVRQVEVWFRQRKIQSFTSNTQKFCECSWHFFFYGLSFLYGLIVLWNKPWFWETKYCWVNWPKLDVSQDIYIYYLIELSFYWSLVFSHVTDHRRKDFVHMGIHHVATILLLYFSWTANFVRIGTIILIAHDAADIWMAAAKMCKYTNHLKLCELLFGVFCLVWVVSRLVYYPFWAIYSVMIQSPEIIGPYPSHKLFTGLLLVLMVLHIIWTYMIARVASQKLVHGELKADIRSDTSASDSD